VAAAVAAEKGVASPWNVTASDTAKGIAKSLLGGERKAVLLGNAAAHHAFAASLLAVAQWIAEQTGASVGYLTEAANTVGAQWVGALPGQGGQNAGQMLAGGVKAAILLNTEPAFDSAYGIQGINKAEMIVSLSPFKANLDVADVLLPIAPWTETPGSFVNAEGLLQSFYAVVRPLGETRPAWKVLRVLGNLLGLPGFEAETAQDVLAHVLAAKGLAGQAPLQIPAAQLDNSTAVAADLSPVQGAPVVASIYQLDGTVRRAPSLQLTADARAAQEVSA